MRMPLERGSEVPLYQQMSRYLEDIIRSGQLPPGTRLPASRRLALDLGVSRITADAAYAELEAEGLVMSRVGSGTYVLEVPPAPPPRAPADDGAPMATWPRWQQDLDTRPAPRDERLTPSPEVVAFSQGVGDRRLFPLADFRRSLRAVVNHGGIDALEYGDPRGLPPLRATIAGILNSQGFRVRPEGILITSGSQQAISLVARLLLAPGDVVLVERPTYAGALDLFRSLGLRPVGVPVDGDGMRVDLVEGLVHAHHPRLIYTIPNFHNPTGTCLASPRRRWLVDLATRCNIPILEDDYVGDLRYDGRAQPALAAIDGHGTVIYVSSFSKMLMPGLRVGFLAASGPVLECLAAYKRHHDLATSNLVQHAVEAYVTVGRYQAHLRRCVQVYRQRRDALVSAVRRHLPPDVTWVIPRGGLFGWLQLPEGLSSTALLPWARSSGVDFAPGGHFFCDAAAPSPGEGDRHLRLNFAACRPDEVEEGVRRLARALHPPHGDAR